MLAKTERSPFTKASDATSTATLSVIPRPVITVVVFRIIRLRRL